VVHLWAVTGTDLPAITPDPRLRAVLSPLELASAIAVPVRGRDGVRR
jgi:hypothetical protein